MQSANVRAGKLLQVKNFIRDDILTPQLDGVNLVFTISNTYIPGTIALTLNGVELLKGSGKDFLETTATTVTLFIAPGSTEELVASYIKS